ncbi:MAG: response regulator [Bacteroidota bacterium]
MKRIIIIEDEAILVKSLEYLLKRLGYETVASADNGADAVKLINDLKPDIVLMDISLHGETDGIETTELINQTENPPPVVFLTAYSEEAISARAKNVMQFGYILKPVDERELAVTLEFALFRKLVSDRERATAKTLATLVNLIDSVVIIIDSKGYVKDLSPKALTLLKTDKENCSSIKFGEIYSFVAAPHIRPLWDPVEHTLKTGNHFDFPEDSFMLKNEKVLAEISAGSLMPVLSGETVQGALLVLKTKSKPNESRPFTEFE